MNWPPDLIHVTPYLRRKDVLQALNLGDVHQPGWTECSGAVGGAFRARNSKPSIQFLPSIIEQVPTLLFSGAEDLICNHLGTEDFINNMEWNGGKGFEISPGHWAPRQDWTFEGEPAGFYQEARNLTYVVFWNSSHMVPFDYARRSRDMLDRFMNVDIASIGGPPTDSLIDGHKGPSTSVGGHPNSTVAEGAEKEKIEKAKWKAYYRSGEVVLVIVSIAAVAWGFFVWRARRRASRGYDYEGVASNGSREGMGLESFRHKRGNKDIEAADFDEAELDELHVDSPREERENGQFDVGSDDDETPKGNGKAPVR